MALTDRQKQIKGLQQQGKKAPEIAAELGISTNAVYQQLRRMKTSGRGSAKAAAKPAAKAAAAPKAAAAVAAAPKAVAVKERPPLTPEKALKVERDAIAAGLKVTAAELESARKAVERAEAAHTAALDGKRDRVVQIDAAILALTGEAPNPLPGFESEEQLQAERDKLAAETAATVTTPDTPPATATTAVAEGTQAPATATEAAPAEKSSNGAAKGATKPATKAAPKGKAKPAAAKPAPAAKAPPVQPQTQAEREAAPEFSDDAAAQAASGEPVPA